MDVTIIAALQPALVLIVAGPLFGEHVTRREVLLTLVSVTGVAIVAKGSESTSAWSLAGDLLAAGSLFAWTAYFLVSKHARETVNALEYLTVVSIAAAVVVTPITLLSGHSLVGAPFGGLGAAVHLRGRRLGGSPPGRLGPRTRGRDGVVDADARAAGAVCGRGAPDPGRADHGADDRGRARSSCSRSAPSSAGRRGSRPRRSPLPSRRFAPSAVLRFNRSVR